MQNLHHNIRYLRSTKNISQRAMAEALSIPLKNYSKYETGSTKTPLQILIKISDHYGISIDSIVRDDFYKNNPNLQK